MIHTIHNNANEKQGDNSNCWENPPDELVYLEQLLETGLFAKVAVQGGVKLAIPSDKPVLVARCCLASEPCVVAAWGTPDAPTAAIICIRSYARPRLTKYRVLCAPAPHELLQAITNNTQHNE